MWHYHRAGPSCCCHATNLAVHVSPIEHMLTNFGVSLPRIAQIDKAGFPSGFRRGETRGTSSVCAQGGGMGRNE